MPDLVDVTNGVVTNNGTTFTINADLTISAGDVLLIDNSVIRIDAPGVLITINGSMNCVHTGDRVKLYGTQQDQFSMRFENATGCNVKKM